MRHLQPAPERCNLLDETDNSNYLWGTMKPQIKLEARQRIEQILGAALALCSEGKHYTRITRDEIARKASIPPTLVTYHMGTMPDLRRAIMREAVRSSCLPVIVQGLVAKDRHALKAPEDLRARALQSLAA